jgi:hypothetical protein
MKTYNKNTGANTDIKIIITEAAVVVGMVVVVVSYSHNKKLK